MGEGCPAEFDSKAVARLEAKRRRAAVEDRAERSARILANVFALAEYQRACTVLWHVGVRTEVETLAALQSALKTGAAVAIPYCVEGRLELCLLQDVSELERGAFGILEPSLALRSDASRRVQPHELDLVLVPGLAFDRHGNRLGYGRGYFDKLLSQARPDATLVGLAFAAQIVDQLPCEPHDIRLHYVITEEETIRITR